MRLFRRILLCLVVGVTAFGAAGWGLRPRATWTIVFPIGSEARPRALRLLEPLEHSSLWISWKELANEDDQSKEHDRVLAIDPETGVVQAEFVLPTDQIDSCAIEGNGHFVVFRLGRDDDGECEEYQRFDGRSNNPVAKFTLPGRWTMTPDARSLWRLEPITNGFRFLQASMTDGRREHEFECLNQYPFYGLREVALSRNGRRLAFCVKDEAGVVRAGGVEIWDVHGGTLVRRVALPPRMLKEEDGVNVPWKLRAGNAASDFVLTDLEAADRDEWYLHADSGEFSKHDTDLQAPSDCPDADVSRVFDEANGNTIAVASQRESRNAWMRVIREHQDGHSWAKFPFPLLRGPISGFDSDFGVDFAVAAVPKRSEIVFMTLEPSIASSVPEALLGLLPNKFRGQITARTVWHDWLRNTSSEIGCSPDERLFQLRPNAYISRADSEDTLELQSWPLPPRDPKWPALGVAIACAVGTWWLCAWRYKRRLRRAECSA